MSIVLNRLFDYGVLPSVAVGSAMAQKSASFYLPKDKDWVLLCPELI